MASAAPARTVHLALGSNLGDREAMLGAALAALAPDLLVEAVSPVYETEPAYLLDQPRFLNQCARAITRLTARETLARLKEIEGRLGRGPGERNAPRPIDLDLLFYEDEVLDTADLIVPHPRIQERAFVLVPLADLAPDLRHPVLGFTIRELLRRLPPGEKEKVWPAS